MISIVIPNELLGSRSGLCRFVVGNVLGTREHERHHEAGNEKRCCRVKCLLLVKFRKCQTTSNTCCAPGSQHETVYFADVCRAERVSGKSRHNRKTAAQTSKKVTGDYSEHGYISYLRQIEIQRSLCSKHRKENVFTAYLVGNGSPEETPEAVKD